MVKYAFPAIQKLTPFETYDKKPMVFWVLSINAFYSIYMHILYVNCVFEIQRGFFKILPIKCRITIRIEFDVSKWDFSKLPQHPPKFGIDKSFLI